MPIAVDYDPSFQETWKQYPPRLGGNSKKAAYKAWKAIFGRKGVTFELAQEVHDGVIRYREYLRQTGQLGTEYVKMAATFFNQECWTEPWAARPTIVPDGRPYYEDEFGQRRYANRALTPEERAERCAYLNQKKAHAV